MKVSLEYFYAVTSHQTVSMFWSNTDWDNTDRPVRKVVLKNFEPVEGINYDAFRLVGAFVGQMNQFPNAHTEQKLFELAIPDKWTVCHPALGISLNFKNVSDKAEKFAIVMVLEDAP